MTFGWWLIAVIGYGASILCAVLSLGSVVGAVHASDHPSKIDPASGFSTAQFERSIVTFLVASLCLAIGTVVVLGTLERSFM